MFYFNFHTTLAYPDYIKIEKGQLYVFNSEGKELWKKPAHGMPDGSTSTGFLLGPKRFLDHNFILIKDVNENDGPEVILFGIKTSDFVYPDYAWDTLYCFSADGKLLWKKSYEVEDFNNYLDEHGVKLKISDMFTIKDKSMNRLFITMNGLPYSPSALLEINGKTGNEKQVYVHYGTITYCAAQKIPGTNQNRIVISGINNKYNKPFLAILDPDLISGKAKGMNGFDDKVNNMNAEEMYYILFPQTKISQEFSGSKYPIIGRMVTSPEGNMRVSIEEFPLAEDGNKGSIFYEFNPDLKIKSLNITDGYEKKYEPFLKNGVLIDKNGKLVELPDSSFVQSLKSSLQYWDGDKFVSNYTQNKKYKSKKTP